MAETEKSTARHGFSTTAPAGPFVLDFYCPSLRLAIELDGVQHAEARNEDADRKRDQWLADHGVTVMRFWNSDAARNRAGVLEAIAAKVRDLRASQATPTGAGAPTSLQGEVDRARGTVEALTSTVTVN